ncbi:MAG: CDP-alcohol phosphatidyltransferase family protein [Christensenellales bacterium]
MQTQKPSNINLPNALTMLRLLLIPVFVYLMAENRMMPALAVFVIASLTDIADGWIARRYNLITDFGKLFDPLADKLMVLSVMVMLAIKGIAPWAAICILLAKEALMLLGGLLLYKRNIVVYAMPIGKAAQLVTIVSLIACFFHDRFVPPLPPIHLYLLWTGVTLALISLVYYARQNGVKLFMAQSGQNDRESRR